MMLKYNYNETNENLGAMFKDLFAESDQKPKFLDIERFDVPQRYAESNPMLSKAKAAKGESAPTPSVAAKNARRNILSIFPNDIIDRIMLVFAEDGTIYEKNAQYYSFFMADKDSKNHQIQDGLKRALDEVGYEYILREMENKIKALIIDEHIDGLYLYLEHCKSTGVLTLKPEHKQKYSAYIKKCQPHKVLARFLLAASLHSPDVTNLAWEVNTDAKEYFGDSMEDILRMPFVKQQKYAQYFYDTSRLDDAMVVLMRIVERYDFIKENELFQREVRCLYGKVLLKKDNGEKACQEFKKCGNFAEAQYQLALYYQKENQKAAAREALDNAAKLKSIDAVLDLAEAYLFGSSVYEISENKDLAEEILANLKEISFETTLQQSRYCYFMGDLAEFEMKKYDSDSVEYEQYKKEALDYYAEAVYLDHHESASKRFKVLSRNKRKIKDPVCFGETEEKKKICFINQADDSNLAFVRQLDASSWRTYSLGNLHVEGISLSSSLANFLKEIFYENGKVHFPDIECLKIAFLSDDETKNINEALEFLDRLYNIAIDLSDVSPFETTAYVKKLIEIVDIYIGADYEYASMLIDASISDMGDIYFRTHICDQNRSAVHELLFKSPLFIPCMKDNGEVTEPKIVAIGRENIYHFIKEALACTSMQQYNPHIVVLGENAKAVERRFYQDCPGIRNGEMEKIEKITPCFFQLDLEHPYLAKILSGNMKIGKDSNAEISEKMMLELQNANYFVVDIGSDLENITFAKKLRGWLLKYDPKFTRLPVIAVRCRDPRNSALGKRLTVGTRNPDEHWFNHYDLTFYGMRDDLYASMLREDGLEALAKNIHLSYAGDEIEKGLQEYYTHSYNQDSSLAMAIGLIYRMYDNGIAFSDYRDYYSADIAMLQKLAEQYDKKMPPKTSSEMEHLARGEQNRWNCFMISRGWEYASPEQVDVYMKQRRSNSHKQDLCKLHPYLCSWENLSDAPASSFSILKMILKKKLTSPRESTIKSIQDTASFFKL